MDVLNSVPSIAIKGGSVGSTNGGETKSRGRAGISDTLTPSKKYDSALIVRLSVEVSVESRESVNGPGFSDIVGKRGAEFSTAIVGKGGAEPSTAIVGKE